MTVVGITSTIPIEVPLTAGVKVIDMNNKFITNENPNELIHQAERHGLSYNLCGWVKGLFAMGKTKLFDRIVVVDGGDCADLVALADFWEEDGIDIIYFNYPTDRNLDNMNRALEQFMNQFEVNVDDVQKTKTELDRVRTKLHEIDRLTWQDFKITGWENHRYLVQSSDFGGEIAPFEQDLDEFIEEVQVRPKGYGMPQEDVPRLGFVGVPPIITDFYQRAEELGGAIVYNETQHQFSMPTKSENLTQQYLNYTYPYGGKVRMNFIEKEIQNRNLDGIILYTENFCYKSIINTYIRSHLKIPAIEIEGKSPEPMDARTRLRLEAFIEMLGD